MMIFLKRMSALLAATLLLSGCNKQAATHPSQQAAAPAEAPVFHVDGATAGSVTGTVTYKGPKPSPKRIDMSEDPACVKAHAGGAVDESLLVGKGGGLENAFVYVEKGLEGKHFAAPAEPVMMDQRGCWFRPRLLGLMVGQTMRVVNDDPVTHNIHPMAVVNREWNHSQGEGEPPIDRRFTKPEVMIPVKCNIHSWMHAYIGVLEHPYFTVTAADGSYSLPNLPPGTYTVAVWHEKLGTERMTVTVPASAAAKADVLMAAK